MTKIILVPTDFSKNALNAVKYAFAYSEKIKSKVVLFHSYTNPTAGLDIPFTNIHYGKQEARQDAEAKMKKLTNTLVKHFPDIKPKVILQPGIASENVIEYVKQNKVNLVIMGTTGQGAFGRMLFGSTVTSVLTDAPCNIIAIPPRAKYKRIEKIAYATDMEKDRLLPLKELVAYARQLMAELVLVHVLEFDIYNAEKMLQDMIDSIRKQMKYNSTSFYVRRDFSVSKGLNYYVKKEKPDILTMVTHSRKFPETIWKTAWTKEMTNHLSVPLLILHKTIPAGTRPMIPYGEGKKP